MYIPVLMKRITSKKRKHDGEWISGTDYLAGLRAVHGSFRRLRSSARPSLRSMLSSPQLHAFCFSTLMVTP